jgi:hypothetical protein
MHRLHGGPILVVSALVATLAVGGAIAAAPVSAAPPACTVQGTEGDDVFQGDDYGSSAVICGGKGDDTVRGVLRGTFVGGPGNDRVLRNKGTVYGGAGRDHVRRNHAQGRFFGGAGNDSVGGGAFGNEGTFRGQDGRDSILTYNGGVFRGGSGNDRVETNLPGGTFHGGPGADHVASNSGVFYGGPGRDTVDHNAWGHLDPGGDVWGTFYGQAGNDHVELNAGTFKGGLGFDTVGTNTGTFEPGPQ